MDRIKKISKRVGTRFLNFYDMEVEHRDGKISPYYIFILYIVRILDITSV